MISQIKKGIKHSLSIVLVLSMIFSITSPAFASDKNGNPAIERINQFPADEKKLLQSAIDDPEFANSSELSTSNQKLIKKITEDPKLNLAIAEVHNNQIILIYNTSDSDVKITSTDGYVEVIERADKNTFIINGEKHHIEYKYEEDFDHNNDITDKVTDTNEVSSTSGSWMEISNPGGGWRSTSSGWHNLHFENAIKSYSAATLAALIGYFVTPLAGVLLSAATLLISSQFSNSSTAKIYRTDYDHWDAPRAYKKSSYHCYAVWQGENKFLGIETKYFGWAPL
jgi:hypothetical protein